MRLFQMNTTMSFGKLRITGGVGPSWYESARPASAYIAAGDANSLGKYGEFAREILQQADAEIDFSRFDSDGPDGLPNSGDDDGVVDALFVVMASTPAGFILRDAAATGVAGLGFEGDLNGVAVQLRGAEIEFHPEVLTGRQGTVNVLPGVRTVAVAGPLPSHYVLPDSFQVAVERDTTIQVVLKTGFQIEGELLDATGERVDTQGLIIFTPVDGGEQFEAQVEDGQYAVGLAEGGYHVQWQNFGNGLFPPQNLGQVETGGDAVIDFVLQHGFAVQGSVMDENRQPLDEGTLRFRSLDSGLTVSAGVTASGAYAVPLLKGGHWVAIHFWGSELPDQDLGIVRVEEDGTFDFSIQRGQPLFGRVVDSVGAGLPGWSITAYALDSSARGIVQSGVGGGFDLPLPPRRYRLVLSARNGTRSTTWVLDEIAAPSVGRVELAASTGVRLNGHVVDGRGRLAQATVLLTRNPRKLYNRTHTGYVAMISTGGDGFYEIEVPPGEYTLIAYPSAQYRLGTAQKIRLDSDRVVDLELPVAVDLRRLAGSLLDDQGNGIVGALVQFYAEQQGWSGQVQTEGDGYYSIDLPPGRYRATAGLSAAVGYAGSRDLGEVEVNHDRQQDLILSLKETAIAGEDGPVPEGFSLRQNYPNPFNATTIIAYRIEPAAKVNLTVYNLAGQQVATLVDGVRQAGTYTIRWDGRDDDGQELASGVYLYRLQTGDGQQLETRKLALVR